MTQAVPGATGFVALAQRAVIMSGGCHDPGSGTLATGRLGAFDDMTKVVVRSATADRLTGQNADLTWSRECVWRICRCLVCDPWLNVPTPICWQSRAPHAGAAFRVVVGDERRRDAAGGLTYSDMCDGLRSAVFDDGRSDVALVLATCRGLRRVRSRSRFLNAANGSLVRASPVSRCAAAATAR